MVKKQNYVQSHFHIKSNDIQLQWNSIILKCCLFTGFQAYKGVEGKMFWTPLNSQIYDMILIGMWWYITYDMIYDMILSWHCTGHNSQACSLFAAACVTLKDLMRLNSLPFKRHKILTIMRPTGSLIIQMMLLQWIKKTSSICIHLVSLLGRE